MNVSFPSFIQNHPLKTSSHETEDSFAELLGDRVEAVMDAITIVPFSGLAYTALSPVNAIYYLDLLIAACAYPVPAGDGFLIAVADDVRGFREALAGIGTPVGFPTLNSAARAARQLRRRISKVVVKFNRAKSQREQAMIARSMPVAVS